LEASPVTKHLIDGPYFEEFEIGQTFGAPSITVTDGHAAVYAALFGDRMRLPLDRHLAQRVTGDARALCHPYLAMHLAAGQTTYASQHVKGNLFYRGVLLQRPVFVGDSLIACRDPNADTGCNDDFDWIKQRFEPAELRDALPRHWDLAPLASDVIGLKAPRVAVGDEFEVAPKDTVTCAPELVRMSLNIAYTHTDETRSYLGQRLVYGGHTISFALAQITRALPNLLHMVAWRHCDHLGPVLEGDLISTRFTVVDCTPVPTGGTLYDLAVEASAHRKDKNNEMHGEKVLDWGA
jgi:2-methylfumaryl-CoA hydratase